MFRLAKKSSSVESYDFNIHEFKLKTEIMVLN